MTKFSDIAIAMVVFTICIMGFMSLINIFADSDPTALSSNDTKIYSDFFNASNNYNDVINLDNSIKANLTGGKFQSDNFLELILGKGYSALMSLITTLSFVNNMILSLGTVFGFIIPSWLPALLVTLVMLIILFSILSTLLKAAL